MSHFSSKAKKDSKLLGRSGFSSPARLPLLLPLRRALILGAACLFLALGIMKKEPLTVLNKAIFICLDCIGMAP